jgi:hypothetical protein
MSNDKWITASEENPDQWSRGYRKEWAQTRHKVRLADGREIYSWWKDGQWSVERLKPHLKVVEWERPVIIA